MSSGIRERLLRHLDATHRPAMRRMVTLLLVLAAIQFCAWLIPVSRHPVGISFYLPLHGLMETISIVIAMMVFAVGWNSPTGKTSGNMVLLGCLFFVVGCLDFSHTVSYTGMPDFISANGPDKHLNFWMTARLLAALALLLVTVRPWHLEISKLGKLAIFSSMLAGVIAFNWVVICYQERLPDLFTDDQGLTALKKNLEYVCIAINLATLLLLGFKMRVPQAFNAPLLFAAAAVMAMGEFYFTLYTTMTGAYNVLGHVYKVISYVIIYRAVVVEAIERPYLQLAQARKNLGLAVEASSTGMIMTDERGIILLTNAKANAMFGYASGAMTGMPIDDLVPHALRDGGGRQMPNHVDRSINIEPMEGRNAFGRHHLGHDFRVEIGLTPIMSDDGPCHIASVVDITDRVESERQINQLINFDPLTGLPNRHLLHDRVSQAIQAAARAQSHIAILFLDLDHFKNVNDTLGHGTGDELLVQVGKRLNATVRESDTVARNGGDEFVLVLPGADAVDAAAVAGKLLASLSHPYQIGIHALATTPSIGIAIYPEDGTDFSVLYQHADTAMYRAKQEGRNGYRFFTAEMQSHSERMLVLECAMQQALERGQYFLHYQPQLSADGSRVVGVEALLRWQHPELGMVSPAEFIPLAEGNGQIIPIGAWVLRTATRQMRRWLDEGLPPMVMAVNLSAVQFRHPDLPALISDILDDAGLAPCYLELELTEGVTMANPQKAIDVINDLHARGVHMSIDDFGTGYSSLSHLKKFKVCKLKIDQSFVRDIATDADDRAIVAAIVQMAHKMGFKAIAEGVETAAQLTFLVQQACDEVQGYLFSRPLPADQIAHFIRNLASNEEKVLQSVQ